MLRPDTQALWDVLKSQSSLHGFVLVGGTALSMHLNHRLSEDLDFMYPDLSLPRDRINILKRVCAQEGIDFVSNDRPDALREFEDCGYDYYDYQQDYIAAGTVKVTFVAPEPEVKALLDPGDKSGPRVASLEEVFRLKCIACANRSKTRDWLDMYVLLTQGLFESYDIYTAFEKAGVPHKWQIALGRMCSGRIDLLDEGYESLLPAPPSVAEMAHYFESVRDQIEVRRAEVETERRG